MLSKYCSNLPFLTDAKKFSPVEALTPPYENQRLPLKHVGIYRKLLNEKQAVALIN